MQPTDVAAILAGSAAFITATAFFLRAVGSQMPRFADAAQRFAEARRQSAKAKRAREEIIDNAFDDLRLRLEKADIRHAAAADELAKTKESLVDLTAQHRRASAELERCHSLLFSARQERDELERAIQSGGGAERKAARPVTSGQIDRTTGSFKTGEKKGDE